MILLLSFLPLALLGGFSYYHSKNYIKDELVSASQTNLQQINHTMDLIIQQLLDSSRQFLLDPVIEEYVSYPDGGYYENYEGNLRAEDLEGYYHYFSAKQKALRRMDILKVTNHYVDSIYLYDAGKNVVLQNGRASTPSIRRSRYSCAREEPICSRITMKNRS